MKHERKNPNAINFGLESRCIILAAKNALNETGKSFSTKSTLLDRWSLFTKWLKKAYYIKDMRKISNTHLIAYSEHLKSRIDCGKLQPSTAQNYLSAVNSIMEIARQDREVRANPVGTCQLPKRSGICKHNKSVSLDDHKKARAHVSSGISILLELQRNFGLRFEESAKLNPVRAYMHAASNKYINITDGTKGGRPRKVPITSDRQVKLLFCAGLHGESRKSMIPESQSYKDFRRYAYREMADLPITFHGQRHHYAQRRYKEITGAACPIESPISDRRMHTKYLAWTLSISPGEAKLLDKKARKMISEELGHSRIDVTNHYLG